MSKINKWVLFNMGGQLDYYIMKEALQTIALKKIIMLNQKIGCQMAFLTYFFAKDRNSNRGMKFR
jgi:hypothetical protein